MVCAKTAAAASSGAARTSGNVRFSNAERSAYFARREAAKVLRLVLQGDAQRQAVGCIKSLVYRPSVQNKKAPFALVCQTLKHFSIIKDVLDSASILNSKWKRQEELVYIITYDILFGQEISLFGDAEKFLMLRKDAIQSELAQLLVRKRPNITKPRCVRANTLKMNIDSVVLELRKQFLVKKDDLVPDLLILPPGCNLHDYPLIVIGSIFLQGKASSMVAAALAPKPGWHEVESSSKMIEVSRKIHRRFQKRTKLKEQVLGACAAAGNKTVRLAALMKGKGKILVCELNKERVKRLEDTVRLSSAVNIEVFHGDILNLDPKDPAY